MRGAVRAGARRVRPKLTRRPPAAGGAACGPGTPGAEAGQARLPVSTASRSAGATAESRRESRRDLRGEMRDGLGADAGPAGFESPRACAPPWPSGCCSRLPRVPLRVSGAHGRESRGGRASRPGFPAGGLGSAGAREGGQGPAQGCRVGRKPISTLGLRERDGEREREAPGTEGAGRRAGAGCVRSGSPRPHPRVRI